MTGGVSVWWGLYNQVEAKINVLSGMVSSDFQRGPKWFSPHLLNLLPFPVGPKRIGMPGPVALFLLYSWFGIKRWMRWWIKMLVFIYWYLHDVLMNLDHGIFCLNPPIYQVIKSIWRIHNPPFGEKTEITTCHTASADVGFNGY